MSAPDTSSAHQVRDDPYTIQEGRTKAPPSSLLGRLKSLGPGIVVSGSIVGSGEILLTAGLGASAGFVLLWWVLLSCWLKSLIPGGTRALRHHHRRHLPARPQPDARQVPPAAADPRN